MNEKERSEEAELILSRETFKEAFNSIEQDIINRLKGIGVSDEQGQKDLVLSLQLLGQLHRRLETHIKTGQLLEFEQTNRRRWRS